MTADTFVGGSETTTNVLSAGIMMLAQNPDCFALLKSSRAIPAASHLGFGSGVHHCLGAPLARRELWWGFTAFLDRIEEFRLAPGKNQLRHVPNFYLRCLKELHIEFTPRKRPAV